MLLKRAYGIHHLLKTGTILLAITAAGALQAKTRWSALHFVPSADFLMGGQYVVDAEGYYFNDTAAKAVLNPAALVDVGIMEWVNVEGGYSGGPTLGFKARIIGESGDYVPSVALGAHNILTNREAGLFSGKDTLTNEVYLALSKSIEPLKMCVHLGLQTIPKSKSDQLDPFFAVEEYFGGGLYASVEVFRREQEFNPSLFVSYRFLKKHLEISAGAVRINRLFFDKNNQFKFALGDTGSGDFVKPGFGLRYCGNFGFGKRDAFTTVEDKVARQNETIRALSLSVDSLKLMIAETRRRMYDVNTTLIKMNDSMSTDKSRMKPILLEKITALKNLYAEEPFEPERVRRAINEIVALHENALPGLREILLDKTLDKHIRVLTVSLLGDIGNTGASDILLDVLSQTQDPDVKIEICIALGKIKETRAEYVLEQLGNDPVDAVAFTAQEVLLKLTKETGMKLSPDVKMRPVVIQEPSAASIAESKIKTKQPVDTMAASPAPAAAAKKSALLEKASPDAAKPKPPDSSKAPDTVPLNASVQPAAKAGQDVWGVGHAPDSAGAHGAQKDSARAQTVVETQQVQSDSAHVAKLDSLLSATSKDGNAVKNAPGKKAKKAAAPPQNKKSAEESDNKNW
jgi:uncharacterized coiled-coil protein SlyX